MLGWFQALMPREDKFFDMFVRHADLVSKGAVELRAVFQGGPEMARHCAEVSRLENEADAVAREVLLAVRRTFITPFDRSDISGLSTSLDDAIDQMQRTVKKIQLFELSAFEPMMIEMADVIVEGAELAARMVDLVKDLRDNSARLSALNVQMTKLEERADELHDQGVKALYLAHRYADPMAYVVGTEIYDHLEKVVDRLEDIANHIVDVVIEQM
ncbi:MAG: DUF47 domain-containing protein [Hyphomicrobiales bacterium]|nr:DUF47 domain-containing protein [Hyphomicrobiales bacterium]